MSPWPHFSVETSHVAATGHLMAGVLKMSDLVFLILTGAFFTFATLVIKGTERL